MAITELTWRCGHVRRLAFQFDDATLERLRAETAEAVCDECNPKMQEYRAALAADRERARAEAERMAARGFQWDNRAGAYLRIGGAVHVQQRRQTERRCAVCGAPAEMMASRGPACPDHYDALS